MCNHYNRVQGLMTKKLKSEIYCKTYTETTLNDEKMTQFKIIISLFLLSNVDIINKGKNSLIDRQGHVLPIR